MGVSQTAAPPAARRNRRRLLTIASTAAAVVLAAVLAAVLFVNRPTAEDYTPKSFTHLHGTTEVTSAAAVAAVGPGDADAVLALGVQPVAIGASGGSLPSWEQDKVTGQPALVKGFLDTNVIADAKPDLIIATGDLDDATYDRLKAIAPTVTRPTDGADAPWTWQAQLTWIGRILERDTEATQLLTTVRSQADDLKNQNPGFTGKSVQAMTVSDDGVGQILLPSNTASYLEGLGLRYNDELARLGTDTGDSRPLERLAAISAIATDVLVVIRTDQAAGSGGFAGLPKEFGYYRGLMVIVDQPDVIAALADPGGYLATEYLNANWVPEVARLVG